MYAQIFLQLSRKLVRSEGSPLVDVRETFLYPHKTSRNSGEHDIFMSIQKVLIFNTELIM
jgi:hypothetical protein